MLRFRPRTPSLSFRNVKFRVVGKATIAAFSPISFQVWRSGFSGYTSRRFTDLDVYLGGQLFWKVQTCYSNSVIGHAIVNVESTR